MPIGLGAAYLIAKPLDAIGPEGATKGVVGAFLLVALICAGVYVLSRKGL